ncbi:MAG: hypothetical protein Q9M28_01080 [Mariprofundaceae bacterium]|nr:hypothetical protein [Mariprofundaceae bacterium]
MGNTTMKRFLMLFALFLCFLLVFLWLRWQAEPWVQPLFKEAGIEVIKVEKELWPALRLQGIRWQNVVLDEAVISPAWWQLMTFNPAVSLKVQMGDFTQNITVSQTDAMIDVSDAKFQISLEMLKEYDPMLAMLPMDGYASLEVSDLELDAQTWIASRGHFLFDLSNLHLSLGQEASIIPDVAIDADFEQGMWHWKLSSDIFKGEGLVKQTVPIQNSTLSGKISFEKKNIPTALQMFLPVQKEQVNIQITGTVTAPIVKWL